MASPGQGQEELAHPTTPRSGGHRYSSYDTGLFSNYNRENVSPSVVAKRNLEAHIADTDQKLQDTSRLESSLVEQRKVLGERLKDLDDNRESNEVAPELKQKLTDLEKEYAEVDRETNRVLIQQSRSVSQDLSQNVMPPIVLNGDGSHSPTKMQGPSRKERNQPSGRVHDIEFATEISTSLLGQVRNLQNLLAEKEEALKRTTRDNEDLQAQSKSFSQRMRNMDDNEQKYKDENWNLETQVQDLTTQLKELQEGEMRLNQTVNSTRLEKSNAEKEMDDLRQSHDRLNDDHTYMQKQHELELGSLKRDVSAVEEERDLLQKRIDELNSQNTELANAMAYRYAQENGAHEQETMADRVEEEGQETPEHSPPPSPSKATPRHGALESETLKSSLHHAHRMIQNLKNNIHREKTEKAELKRMLQDARDDIEARRTDGGVGAGSTGKRRKANAQQDIFKKPPRPDKLGGAKSTTEDIWEDYEGSPSRRDTLRPIKRTEPNNDTSDAFESANERLSAQDTSDAFETATERDSNTETDAFHTGAESLAGDSSDELTETEQSVASRSQPRLNSSMNRTSFLSSASDEEDNFDLTTPPRQSKYKLRVNKGGFSRASETPSANGSPASFVSNQSGTPAQQNLAAELADFGEGSSVATSTPSRSIGSLSGSPAFTRGGDSMQSSPQKPLMVDAGTITDHSDSELRETSLKDNAMELTGAASIGAVAGALGSKIVDVVRSRGSNEPDHEARAAADLNADQESPEEMAQEAEPLRLSMSDIAASETAPLEPPSFATEQPVVPTETTIDNDTMAKKLLGELEQHSTVVPSSTIALARRLASTSTATESADPVKNEPAVDEPSLPSQEHTQHDQNTTLIGAAAAAVGLGSIPIIGSALTGNKTSPSDDIDAKPSVDKSLVQEDGTSNNPTFSTLSRDENDDAFSEPTLESSSLYNDGPRQPLKQISGNEGFSPTTRSLERKVITSDDLDKPSANKPNIDEGTQTTVSSEQIENLLKDRARRLNVFTGQNHSPVAKSPPGKSPKAEAAPIIPPLSPKRPSSASSARKSTSQAPIPPLPPDHKEVIAAASRTSVTPINTGSLNPPGSAQKSPTTQIRPRTPSNNVYSTPTKSQPPSIRGTRPSSLAGSRRSSVSSFASEIDERFNLPSGSRQGGVLDGYEMSSADPRMIQAITQTMIGEFMWKYTRKAGRGNLSANRHKRFFWIHPYTRTLYWSNQDPSSGGRTELKAKSVGIEGIRVVSDDNPMPPGLHPKSIVVVTPGRSIKLTAATSNRHETWFNALSYLLLRSNPEQHEEPTLSRTRDRGSTAGSIRSLDPGFDPSNYARSTSRLSQRGSVSGNRSSAALPSNVHRASSPQGASRSGSMTRAQEKMPASSLGTSGQMGAVSIESREKPEVFKKPTQPASQMQHREVGTSRNSRTSTGSRIGSLTSIFRPGSGTFGSVSKRGRDMDHLSVDDPARSSIASTVTTSRNSASGSREREEVTMENVRACCDGKHDISSLAAHGGHHHHHHSRGTSLNRNGSTSSRVSGTWASRLGMGTGSARNSAQELPADPANYS